MREMERERERQKKNKREKEKDSKAPVGAWGCESLLPSFFWEIGAQMTSFSCVLLRRGATNVRIPKPKRPELGMSGFLVSHAGLQLQSADSFVQSSSATPVSVLK